MMIIGKIWRINTVYDKTTVDILETYKKFIQYCNKYVADPIIDQLKIKSYFTLVYQNIMTYNIKPIFLDITKYFPLQLADKFDIIFLTDAIIKLGNLMSQFIIMIETDYAESFISNFIIDIKNTENEVKAIKLEEEISILEPNISKAMDLKTTNLKLSEKQFELNEIMIMIKKYKIIESKKNLEIIKKKLKKVENELKIYEKNAQILGKKKTT